MAARVAPGDLQQLHHFVSTSPWATEPLKDELVRAADRLVGGADAGVVVGESALGAAGRGDAEYGRAAEFRAGLAERRRTYAVGVMPVQQVYPADVTLAFPERKAT